jgi:AbrB family transcriptional regulator (stage V sporulation protein T)
MKNTGVIRKIDELGRIVIPKEIRKNLSIGNGEDVQIYVEEDKIILKKYQKVLTIKENAQKYLNMFCKITNSQIYVTDREKVIASSNLDNLDVNIDNKIVSLINDRRSESGFGFKLGEVLINKKYYLSPMIVDADAIGGVIIVTDNDVEEKDKVIVKVINSLLCLEFN